MKPDARALFTAALDEARRGAYPTGEYVGQESFMTAAEIRRLADAARIGAGVRVLDACCGVAGDLPCRFEQAVVPPLPRERFEVVLLLETMLALPGEEVLVAEVARVLEDGGRFACTVEVGAPLTDDERAAMPDADTVRPVELPSYTGKLQAAGLTVTWQEDWTAAHAATATALLKAFRQDAAGIARGIGARAVAELIAAHELWVDWLGSGRVRKVALVAEQR